LRGKISRAPGDHIVFENHDYSTEGVFPTPLEVPNSKPFSFELPQQLARTISAQIG
jgi:hypothetical protein